MTTAEEQIQIARQAISDHANKDLLRFITCGSVDDGKSTLIGRLMLEAGAIYEDQIIALQRDSERHGTTGGKIDTALLLDGLEDERQQGITIDVAYRYFATNKRKFIIADTPGHEQYTRNMATGASNADLAIILVDASKGVLTQTKRHAFIVSLLGIKHVVLAVNKMDLVDFSEDVFDQIRDEFSRFATKLEIPDIRFIPLSALNGDNVAEPSCNTLWHADGSLLHLLETVYIGGDRNHKDLRFPVQWVNRPDATFRGFSGKIASGTVRVGDEVVSLPSRKVSKIQRIVTFDGDINVAESPLSVTIELEDEIDVTRGDMLARPGNQPRVSNRADSMLVWMSEQPLVPHRRYWFKSGNHRTSCEVESIRYQVDVNTLHRTSASSLQLNEIGRCSIATHDPIVFDPYRRNRETGSFILVDRITNETAAAGMFLDHTEGNDSEDVPMATRLRPVKSRINADDRARVYKHRPRTFLITGLSGSGKTTFALELEKRLFDGGKIVTVLDGENMRTGLSADLGFSKEECSENLRRAAEVARVLNESGQICIAAFVAPEEAMRKRFKQIVGEDRCYHIHMATPIELCRERDTTGRYEAADNHKIRGFPGVDVSYEQPKTADFIVKPENKTAFCTVLQQMAIVMKEISWRKSGADSTSR